MFSLETKAPTHCPVKFGGGDELESPPPPQLIMETITTKRRATKPRILHKKKLTFHTFFNLKRFLKMKNKIVSPKKSLAENITLLSGLKMIA